MAQNDTLHEHDTERNILFIFLRGEGVIPGFRIGYFVFGLVLFLFEQVTFLLALFGRERGLVVSVVSFRYTYRWMYWYTWAM